MKIERSGALAGHTRYQLAEAYLTAKRYAEAQSGVDKNATAPLCALLNVACGGRRARP